MTPWSEDEQAFIVDLRHRLAAKFQKARREGRIWAARWYEWWLDGALSAERTGRRLLKGL